MVDYVLSLIRAGHSRPITAFPEEVLYLKFIGRLKKFVSIDQMYPSIAGPLTFVTNCGK